MAWQEFYGEQRERDACDDSSKKQTETSQVFCLFP